MPYTPGPWSVVECEDFYPGIDAGNHSVVLIGEPRISDDGGVRGRDAHETLANARLIAAAPDMVDALQQARSAINAALEKAGV